MQSGLLKQCLLYTPVLFIGLLLSACENDLNKVRAIAAADATKPIQRTTGVDMIVNDSSKLKARLLTPLLLEYDTKDSLAHKFMPNGVKVILFNGNTKPEGTITADTGYFYDAKELVKFKKNVVAVNDEGTKYQSEELLWDRKTNKVYSNQKVLMTKPTGDQMEGTSFESVGLKNPIFQNATAIIHVEGDPTQ
ncbi:LPS export ABC transporter periplasmic protein LptC [Mucilaginibacter conchicola]|uniref:LPS export ABC transporter periplasmic protein LptC n=1 Tax=Mucilaginibacter conchicola TaxID=2303333 RepID=A0A372NTG4_9SPHI|nr:LPS export ABC transporter periplasmic protein LptC [Mucilaginibacter conchicola]RFZ91887.1 LPS export ABC transporter periplasmic protein LptC [Mucilaginibacter conchicola]